MDKAEIKMIEEMAKHIDKAKHYIWNAVNLKKGDYSWHSRGIAEALYNANYRKIGEDEIVIKKSEYSKLCVVEYESADEEIREILQEVRKIVVGKGTWQPIYDMLVARLAKSRSIELE